MWKIATNVFTKKTHSSSSKGAIIKLFEEALDFRVSPKHGGRRGTTKEEQAAPWWHEEYTKFIHAVYRTAKTHRRATHSTMMLN
jgi:hypothetical protein